MKGWLKRKLGLDTGNEAEDQIAEAGLTFLALGFGLLAGAGYLVHWLSQYLPPL